MLGIGFLAPWARCRRSARPTVISAWMALGVDVELAMREAAAEGAIGAFAAQKLSLGPSHQYLRRLWATTAGMAEAVVSTWMSRSGIDVGGWSGLLRRGSFAVGFVDVDGRGAQRGQFDYSAALRAVHFQNRMIDLLSQGGTSAEMVCQRLCLMYSIQ